MGFQEDINEIKQVLANSKLRSELPPGTPENGDLVGFFNSVLNREERIEWSQFVGLAASAGITFEPNGDFYDVKVNASTVFQVSKAGQTGQYADVLNPPDLTQYQLKNEKNIAFGYVGLNASSQILASQVPFLAQYEQIANKGVANGYASLDSNGKIPEAQIPSLAINDFILVIETDIASFAANESSYTFQQGDVIRLDNGNGQNYFYTGGTKTDIANYALINGFVTPNLQEVTDQGATTTNEVESTSAFKSPQFKISNSGFEAILSALLTASRNISFQDQDGTVALLSDVTAAAILAKLLTVDGSGSGLDADLLSGLASTLYLRNQLTTNLAIGNSSNLNGSYTGVFYSSGGASNQPPTGNSHIISQTIGSGFTQQIGGRQNRLFFRHEESGIWANWSEIWNSGRAIRTSILSGYTTALTLASLGDNDWITKKQFNDNGAVVSEGTFTPVLNGGGANYTYSEQIGEYYKIGKQVYININIAITGTTGTPSGGYTVTGLPFTSKSSIQQNNFQVNTSGLGANFYSINAKMFSSQTQIQLFVQSGFDQSNLSTPSSATITSGTLVISGSYITD